MDLFERARKGDVSILNHPDVATVRFVEDADQRNNTPLHFLALYGKVEVLGHPEVATVKNNMLWTPLHYLALAGKVEVLNHPDVAIVRESQNKTPLHYLSSIEVLNHPEVATVVDDGGWTPLHINVREGNVKIADIRKLFPWYKGEGEVTLKMIDEILETSNFEIFLNSI